MLLSRNGELKYKLWRGKMPGFISKCSVSTEVPPRTVAKQEVERNHASWFCSSIFLKLIICLKSCMSVSETLAVFAEPITYTLNLLD